MLHYHPLLSGSAPTIQVYRTSALTEHICGYWLHQEVYDYGPHPDPENPWVLYFPEGGAFLYFKDEDTLKTFLELHWEEYHRG